MDPIWKIVIEIFIRLLLKWLDENDKEKAVMMGTKAGAAAKAFKAEYTA